MDNPNTDTQIQKAEVGNAIERVLISGDLSKLTPDMRVQYYQRVCQSLGLNPLTKPFSYITLNGKLTLYALKDATDQLRKIHEVSIDDVDIKETDAQFIVKVKGHDKTGRTDVEIGVVNKTDMQNNLANAQMKAVTKSKRRLTLSLCGLGWLDETEIETIPDARPLDPEGFDDAPAAVEEEVPVIQYIQPLSSDAVKYAAKEWNISEGDAAKEIGKAKLKHMTMDEFKEWVRNPNPK